MKHIFSFFAIFVFFSLTLNAQETGNILVAKRLMSQGTNNSYLIELVDVNKAEALKSWQAFVNPYRGKTKYNRKTKEYVTTEATIPSLGGLVTLYAKIVEESTDPDVKTTVILWYNTPSGFAGEEGETVLNTAGLELSQRYAISTSYAHAKNVQDAEQQHLDDLEKALRQLRNDRDSYQKKLQVAEQTVIDMTTRIEVNTLDIQQMEETIEQQRETVKSAEDKVRSYNGGR